MKITEYLPIFLFIIIGISLGILLISLGKLLGPNRPDKEKNSPYECGFKSFQNARMKFDIRYHRIAILFIIFDLETIFIFPWACSNIREIEFTGFIAMMIFFIELILGFMYIWKKGALNWE